MESEDSPKEEDVSMKLLPNEGEIPDYKSGGNLDVSITQSEEFEDVSDTYEYQQIQDQIEEEHMKTVEWIKETFEMKYCKNYVRRNDYEERCHCGRTREEHEEISSEERNIDSTHNLDDEHVEEIAWNPDQHLGRKETNAYGEVVFHMSGSKSKAKYIRLAAETDIEEVAHLLLYHWNLDLLVAISIYGDDQISRSNPKLAAAVSEGLALAANMESTWIITGGTDMELVRSVGKKTTCIGIAPWGTTHNRKDLTNVGETVKYNLSGWLSSKSASENEIYLGKNHTHFLLVDDGYVNKSGGEMDLRKDLENYYANSVKGVETTNQINWHISFVMKLIRGQGLITVFMWCFQKKTYF